MSPSKKHCYKYFVVPKCKSTTISTPENKFIIVPKDVNLRKQWCQVMGRDVLSQKTTAYCCEDHFDVNEEATALREAEIEKKRNKSRLSAPHYNLVNGRKPYEESKCVAHETVKYNRKIFGKYGTASGVNPSICWPTKDELAVSKLKEHVAYPYTIQQVMLEAKQAREEKQRAARARDAEVAAHVAKLQQWKKEMQDRVDKKMAISQAAKEKKERLIDEVRRHFGFKLDPRDDRFKEMLEKREKEQRKQEKQLRKEAKEKQAVARLQQKTQEMS